MAITLAAGQRLTASLLSSITLTGAWTPFTVSWTGATTNPAIGNGTLTGTYKKIDVTVFFNIFVLAGSTTTYGSGAWLFNLPFAPLNDCAADVAMRDQSAGANWTGSADIRAGATATAITRIGTPTGTPADATHPFTWASTDRLKISGVYETS